ncbi:MAG: O-antigen ligase family protein [Candidatus Kerfeldbacteria bacterium]
MDNQGTKAKRRTALLSTTALLAAVAAGFVIGVNPLLGSIMLCAVVIGIAVFTRPAVGIALCILSLILGQLVRIPAFGTEGAILPNDIILPGLFAGWLLKGLLERRVGFPSSPLSWPIGTMLGVFVLTFIAGIAQLPFVTTHEQFVAALYIIRWLEYALLFFVVADTVRTQKIGARLLWTLFVSAVALAVLGFVQLKLFPDFGFMVPKGWDPHIGRLLSTWFDPNFLGGFFSFIAVTSAGIAFFVAGRQRTALWTVAALMFIGLVLTFSRSGYAAFIVGVTVLTFIKSRRFFLLLVVVAALVVMGVPRVQERVLGAFRIDETAKTRIVSWQNALSVVRDFPVTGIGYNTYRYVQVDYGFQKNASEHSAGGSDSSLLTILVTTGPAGLAVYLWLLWAYVSIAWQSYHKGTTPLIRGLGLGALSAIASVTAHSLFINSLLFPHMMETIAVVFGVLVGLRYVESVP